LQNFIFTVKSEIYLRVQVEDAKTILLNCYLEFVFSFSCLIPRTRFKTNNNKKVVFYISTYAQFINLNFY